MLTFCEYARETRMARLSVYLKAAFTAFKGRSLVASDFVGKKAEWLTAYLESN